MEDVRQIESVLGWALEAELAGSISSLNAIPDRLIAEARRLPPILRLIFLRHYTTPDDHPYLPGLIDDVVEGGEDVAHWRRGRILVPGLAVSELVTRDIASILGLLGPSGDERWHRVSPDRDDWNRRVFITGAPALLRPNVDYRYVAPPQVMDLLVGGTLIEQVADIVIMTRRWIGACIAGAAQTRGLLRPVSSGAELLSTALPAVPGVSNDALIAVEAVLAELRLLGPSDADVPGFRGPDEWYAGMVPQAAVGGP